MSLRSFHVFFMGTALSFMGFLLYWAGRRYVHEASAADLPLAVAAFAGICAAAPYLYWFLGKGYNNGRQ